MVRLLVALLVLPDAKAAHDTRSGFQVLYHSPFPKDHGDECERDVQKSLGLLTLGNGWVMVCFPEIKRSEDAYFGDNIMGLLWAY